MKRLAVYGKLRKQGKFHVLVTYCPFLGVFRTAPQYFLYRRGNRGPGLKEGGSTEITVEVYEVHPFILAVLDLIEYSYCRRRIVIPTLLDVDAYFYLGSVSKENLLLSGDWEKR